MYYRYWLLASKHSCMTFVAKSRFKFRRKKKRNREFRKSHRRKNRLGVPFCNSSNSSRMPQSFRRSTSSYHRYNKRKPTPEPAAAPRTTTKQVEKIVTSRFQLLSLLLLMGISVFNFIFHQSDDASIFNLHWSNDEVKDHKCISNCSMVDGSKFTYTNDANVFPRPPEF